MARQCPSLSSHPTGPPAPGPGPSPQFLHSGLALQRRTSLPVSPQSWLKSQSLVLPKRALRAPCRPTQQALGPQDPLGGSPLSLAAAFVEDRRVATGATSFVKFTGLSVPRFTHTHTHTM